MEATGTQRCARWNVTRNAVQAVADHSTSETYRLTYHQHLLPGVLPGRAATQVGQWDVKQSYHAFRPRIMSVAS
jgi:hypothetical protein